MILVHQWMPWHWRLKSRDHLAWYSVMMIACLCWHDSFMATQVVRIGLVVWRSDFICPSSLHDWLSCVEIGLSFISKHDWILSEFQHFLPEPQECTLLFDFKQIRLVYLKSWDIWFVSWKGELLLRLCCLLYQEDLILFKEGSVSYTGMRPIPVQNPVDQWSSVLQ